MDRYHRPQLYFDTTTDFCHNRDTLFVGKVFSIGNFVQCSDFRATGVSDCRITYVCSNEPDVMCKGLVQLLGNIW